MRFLIYTYLLLLKKAAASSGEFSVMADESSRFSASSSSDIEMKNVISSVRASNIPESLTCFIADTIALKKKASPGKVLWFSHSDLLSFTSTLLCPSEYPHSSGCHLHSSSGSSYSLSRYSRVFTARNSEQQSRSVTFQAQHQTS